MGEYNPSSATTSSLTTTITDYSVTPLTTDTGGKEYRWTNSKAKEYLGYYKKIPELKKAIDALALYTSGKGYQTDLRSQIVLEHITGWGEDTFNAIVWNLIVCKKIFGDAYAEIIRDGKTQLLLNMKVLDPAKMTHITDEKGMLIRYEYQRPDGTYQKFDKEKIFHISNDRIADECHGVSVIECVQWVIDARNEAMTDFRNVLHRNMHFRYMEVDFDDTTTMTALKTQYANSIKNGEILLLPKGTAEMKTIVPSIIDPQSWIRYLENFFYNALGVPKVILGGSEEFTESSAKVGVLTFQQVYEREQEDFKQDFWNQVHIQIEFVKPVSLKNEMITNEQKNTGQVGFQPHETERIGMGEGQ